MTRRRQWSHKRFFTVSGSTQVCHLERCTRCRGRFPMLLFGDFHTRPLELGMSLMRGSGPLVLVAAVWLALPAGAQSRHLAIEGMWSNPPAIPVGRLCAFYCTDHAI